MKEKKKMSELLKEMRKLITKISGRSFQRQEESRGSEVEHAWSVKGTAGGQGVWLVVCEQQMSQRHRRPC